MANPRQAELHVDDTGADGDGTYVKLDAIVNSDAVSKWNLTAEQCRGDTEITYSADIKEFEIPFTAKFIKSDAILERLLAAHESGDSTTGIVGVKCATGPITVGAANAGNLVLTMNAIVEEFTITKQLGNMIEVRGNFKPHAGNADATLPDITIVAAA